MSRRRLVVVVLAALVGVPLAALVVAFAAGVSIDLSRWREAAAHQASLATGRKVGLQGPLELTLGRELLLRAGGVRIANAPGFVAPDIATVGELRARVDLAAAWQGRMRLHGVQASDIVLWLERSADGRSNWAATPPSDPAAPPAELDLGLVTLKQVSIRYDDARSSRRHRVEVDELSGQAGPGQAVHLALRGRLDARPAFALRIDAGAPRQPRHGGEEPWPFTIDVKTAGAWWHAGGQFDRQRGVAHFDFGAGADDLASVGRLLGVSLPALGRTALYGRAAVSAQAVELTRLQGRLGATELAGRLTLDLDRPRWRLHGALQAARLDLGPQPADAARPEAPVPDDEVAWQGLALRDLLPVDVDLDLQVGRWVAAGMDLQDARVALHGDARGVHAPFAATVAGHAMAGVFRLDTAGSVPSLALELDASDLALGPLSQALWGAAAIDGGLKRFGLRVAGRGETWRHLVRDLDGSLALDGLQLRGSGRGRAAPVLATVDRLDLTAGRGERLRGSARGTLLGVRARLAIRGGTLPDLLGERAAPVEVDLALAAATLRMAAVADRSEPARSPALSFDFQARRAGDLERWLDVAPASDLPVALRGRVRRADDAWHLDAATLRVGRSELVVDARHRRVDGRPFTTASVRSPMLDLPELATLAGGTRSPAGTGSRPDARLVATAVELADADVALDLQHVVLARTQLDDVALRARSRNGRLGPAALAGQWAGAPFAGQVEIDLGTAAPQARLDLSTGAIDLGALLRGLGVAEDIDGTVERLRLALSGRGHSLRELAGSAALEASVIGGSVTMRGAAERPVAEIRLHEAIVDAAPGEPVRVRLDGAIEHTPVRIEASSGSFADFLGDAKRLPFAMNAQGAGTRLSLDGEVSLPLGREGELRLEMNGERLDALSNLARVELPPWGPWSLSGPIRMTSVGYEVRDLAVAVGRSRLSGSGTLDLSGPRPYLQVQVAASAIQLDEFPLPQRLADPEEPPQPDEGLRGQTGRLADRIDRLLSRRFLRRLDADIDVEVAEVRSGIDRLGDGKLHLRLRNGRLGLDPAMVNLPGGSLRLAIDYDPKESEIDFAAAAHIERFDYGIIARRWRRADDLHGLFSLDLELAGRAPSLDTIMRRASGRLDFAVWPTELRSGMFDLWSANLVLRLLPLIDPGGKSQVNCIVGRFDLRDGDLSDDKILIDTTTVRIRGTGHANLATEDLEFVFRPRAKGIGLFRLQTPLRVTGTLYDQRFGFERRDVWLSVLQLIAAPILVPVEWLRLGLAPRDGADLCTDPLRAGSR